MKLLSGLVMLLATTTLFAQETMSASGITDKGLYAIGAGLAIALAAMGCAIGQGLAASAALEGVSRNPSASGKIQGQLILSLALIESLAIYALVIAFLIKPTV